MLELIDELKQLVGALERRRCEYALCGGLAMAVYRAPRATLDIDLLVPVEQVAAVKAAAGDLGFRADPAPLEFAQGQVRMHRLMKPDPGSEEFLVLDLIEVSPMLADAWRDRRRLRWRDGDLHVVSPRALIGMKKIRGSGIDQDDIRYLETLEP